MSNSKPCLMQVHHAPHVWRSNEEAEMVFAACPGVTALEAIAGVAQSLENALRVPECSDLNLQDAPDPAALSDDFAYIRHTLVPEWLLSFERKSREYGQMHRELGIRAQYVDVNRKTAKLRLALWEGVDTSDWREQPREIAEDLVGHLFLLLAMMDRMDELEGAG